MSTCMRRSGMVAANAGYIFPGTAWTPRFGVKTDIASGDHDRSDSPLGTFNAMYPKLAALSEPALVAPANLIDIQPGVSVRPLYRQPSAILGRLVTGRLDRPRLLVCPLQGRRHPREGRRP